MTFPAFTRLARPAVFAAAGLVLGLVVAPRLSPAPAAAPQQAVAWTDFTSADPAIYAANLRAIGCPEEIIRRILTIGDASVRSAAPLAASESARPAAPASAAAPVASSAADVRAAQQEMVIVAPEGRVPLPAAFQPIPQDAQMTPAQRSLLNSIQDDFIAAIGGPNQNPASPQYQDRWRRAQRRCDELLKVAFGDLAFMRRQMAALRAEQTPPPGS